MITFKAPHDGTVLQFIVDRVNSINYFNSDVRPNIDSMEVWEALEHTEGFKETVSEYIGFRNIILGNVVVFNNILKEYGLSVESFLEKLVFTECEVEARLKNRISSNTIYKGFSYEEAIMNAIVNDEVWIEEQYVSSEVFASDDFENYVLMSHGQFAKIRTKRLPKFCNSLIRTLTV